MYNKISYEDFLTKFGDYYKYDSKISLLQTEGAELLLKENTNKYIVICKNEIFLHNLNFIREFKSIKKAMIDNGYKGIYKHKVLGNKKADEMLESLELQFIEYEDLTIDNCFGKETGPHTVQTHLSIYQFEI